MGRIVCVGEDVAVAEEEDFVSLVGGNAAAFVRVGEVPFVGFVDRVRQLVCAVVEALYQTGRRGDVVPVGGPGIPLLARSAV